MFFTMDCWQFFLSAFEDNADIIVSRVNRKICHNRSSFDLRQEKVRISSVLDVVTINTTEGLWALCSIMGSCFGVGVRKKFPKVRERVSNCGFGDTINYLNIRLSTSDKVSFRYDVGASKLNVCIKYSNFVVERDIEAPMDGLPQVQHIVLPKPSTGTHESAIIVGCHFMIGDTLYEVESVQNDNVHCTVRGNDGQKTSVDLSVDVANGLIDDYNIM